MHPASQPSFIEDALIVALQRNAALAIPLFLLILKIFIRWAGDKTEFYRHILPLPVELLFIGMGLITAGISRSIPAFARHYTSDNAADLAGAIILIALSLFAIGLTRLNIFSLRLWQRFQVSIEKVQLHVAQPSFSFSNPSQKVGLTLAWGFAYFMMAVLLWGAEVAFAVSMLWRVFLRIQP